MAKGKRISEQPILDALVGDELIPFAKNGGNGAVEADTIKEYAQDGLDDKYANKSDTYTKSEVDGLVDGATSTAEATYAKKEDVPTKVSELENDSKFQTESEVDGKLTDKVDKVDGKGLSSNDFTDEDKAKLDRFELVLANDDEIEDGLHQIASSEDYRSKLKENGYVVYHDVKYKVKDCGVTSDSYPWIITEGAIITANEDGELNDHTQKNIVRSVYIWFDTILHYQPYGSIIPSKVSELQNDLKYQTEAQLANSLAILYESLDSQLVDEYTHLDNKKVDKVEGKGLSTNDYTTDDKDKLGALPTNSELTTTLATKADKTSVGTELAKKVDKVSGKQLSTEDFTTLLKQKLEGLTNYDDSTLTTELNALKSRLDTLVGSGDVTAVIDTFQEIEAFLQGVTNTQTLTGLLQEMKGEIVAMIPTNYAKIIDFKLNPDEIGKLSNLYGSYLLSNRGTNSAVCSLIWISTYNDGGYNRTTSRVIYNKGIEAYIENNVNIATIYVKNTHTNFINCSVIALSNKLNPIFEIVDDLPENITQLTTNANTLITANGTSSQFLKADGSVDGTAYMPKSGGDFTGNVTFKNNLPAIQANDVPNSTHARVLYFKDFEGNNVTAFGSLFDNNDYQYSFIGWGTEPWIGNNSLAVSDTKFSYKNNKVWHAGNDGANSGLDADMLDGKQPADLNVGSAAKLTTKQLTNEDLNTIKDINFSVYFGNTTNTCLNKPNGVTAFKLMVLSGDANAINHVLVEVLTGAIFTRRYYGAVWSPWKKMLTEGDASTGTTSADSPIDVIDTEDADFIIADEDENPLVVFADGHIRTANFDSANISTTANKIEMALPGKWCALGTSITAWDATNVNGIKGYQYWVKKRISFGSYVNKGVNGSQMASLATNLDLIVEADYYTLEFGTNDLQGNLSAGTLEDYVNSTGITTFAGAMRIVIDKIYEVNPSALVILCTPRKFYNPDFGIASWTSANSVGAKLVDFVNVIKEIAQYESFPVADFFALSNTNSHNLVALSNEEALHPTTTGHQLMANVLVEQFKLLYQY